MYIFGEFTKVHGQTRRGFKPSILPYQIKPVYIYGIWLDIYPFQIKPVYMEYGLTYTPFRSRLSKDFEYKNIFLLGTI